MALLRLLILSTLLLMAGVGAAQPADCEPASGEAIRLGAIFPANALFTARASAAYQGAEAMRQAVNGCGGVDGRPVEWVFQPANDRSDAAEAAAALVEAGVPVVVGSGLPAVSEGARPVVTGAGVVYWEVTEALESGSLWAFSPRANNRQLGQATGRFVESEVRAMLGAVEPRVALIYNTETDRPSRIAEGVLETLSMFPVIDYPYSEGTLDAYQLGDDIRDNRVNVVIFSGFDDDGEWLWYALRESDANIKAWIHVGSEGYREDLCAQSASTQAFMSVVPSAPVDPAVRQAALGGIYDLYEDVYMREYGAQPDETADLSASGVYLLLTGVLPRVEGDYTADAIREVLAQPAESVVGMMGETLRFDVNGVNEGAAALVRQQQGTRFCTVSPDDVATCGGTGEIIPFPTWRERAISEEAGLFCGAGA